MLKEIEQTHSIEVAFQSREEFSNDPLLVEQYNALFPLKATFETQRALFVDRCRNTFLPRPKKKNAIQVCPMEEMDFDEEDYVFLLGFNQNIIPKLYKDEDFISDRLKQEVVGSTTQEKNQQEKKKVLNFLNGTPHLTITYKKKSPFDEYYPSSLCIELAMKPIKNPHCDHYAYSNQYNQIKLARKLDRFTKYREVEEGLSTLFHHYPNLPYHTYDPQFSGIDLSQYEKHQKRKLLLSYTSLNTYNLCGFRYYLQYILKLDSFEETFPIFIGNLYHKLLAMAFLPGFELDYEFDQYQKTRTLTAAESFLLKKLKQELMEVIELLKQQQEWTSYKQALYEQELTLSIPSEWSVSFKGTIDKILYQEHQGKSYVAIIDYKSGGIPRSLSPVIYGLDMQLPIYYHLIKRSQLFEEPVFTGFYFQKILFPEMRRKEGTTLKQQKKDRLKLQGYSTDQEEILEQFDSTYQNSEMIQGMKMTSKGFAHYTKVLKEQEVNRLLELTEQKIQETVDKIQKADFKIDPKQIGKENVSCTFCAFQDICYHTSKDMVYLKDHSGLGFLGGEQDG